MFLFFSFSYSPKTLNRAKEEMLEKYIRHTTQVLSMIVMACFCYDMFYSDRTYYESLTEKYLGELNQCMIENVIPVLEQEQCFVVFRAVDPVKDMAWKMSLWPFFVTVMLQPLSFREFTDVVLNSFRTKRLR